MERDRDREYPSSPSLSSPRACTARRRNESKQVCARAPFPRLTRRLPLLVRQTQSLGWVHYLSHSPEPHIVSFFPRDIESCCPAH